MCPPPKTFFKWLGESRSWCVEPFHTLAAISYFSPANIELGFQWNEEVEMFL